MNRRLARHHARSHLGSGSAVSDRLSSTAVQIQDQTDLGAHVKAGEDWGSSVAAAEATSRDHVARISGRKRELPLKPAGPALMHQRALEGSNPSISSAEPSNIGIPSSNERLCNTGSSVPEKLLASTRENLLDRAFGLS